MATGKIYIKDNSGNVTEFVHQHTTEEVTSLNGYEIATTASAISSTDTLNVALGKIQKSIDGKQAALTNMSSAEANTGTATTARAISAKVLNDKIASMLPGVTVSTSGSGDAVVGVSATNHSITVTKGGSFATTDHSHSYLPLAGGTVTGKIVTTVGNFIYNNTDTSYVRFFGGATTASGSLYLRGKDATGTNVTGGEFSLTANNGTNSAELKGKPDGTLTWTGKAVSLSDHNHDGTYLKSISGTNTGTGNAVTAISVTNGTVTATKGITFSTEGHTHNYSATGHKHVAADITSGTFDAARIPNLDASKIASGTISIDRLPAAALERLVSVTNETARYALTTANVQKGDTVRQIDTGLMYIVVDDTKLNTSAGYAEYSAGTASKALVADAVAWTSVTGRPTIPTIPNLSISTSGSGNVVTAVTVSGHAITLTKGSSIPTIPNISISTSTHTGNAITSMSASGHTITVSKEQTFSTNGHTHTFPSLTATSTGAGNAYTTITVSNHAITMGKTVTFSTDGHTHAAYSPTNHTHSYLPLAGGTMTGNIVMSASKSVTLDMSSTTPTAYTTRNIPITIKSKDTDNDFVFSQSPFFEIPVSQTTNYGMGIGIGANGMVIVGGGESSRAIVAQATLSGGTEQLVLTSDGVIRFFTGCNTIANSHEETIDATGKYSGTASNAEKLGGVVAASYSQTNHTHTAYSPTNHNHSGVYSPTDHTHSYLPLTGGTITGNLIRKNTGKTRGTAPTANVNAVEVYGQDSAAKTTWGIYNTYSTAMQNQVQLIAYSGLTTDNTWAGIGVGYDSSGNVFTNAPNPAAGDSSSKIATTKFVKDQGYAAGTHTHSYLPLAGGTMSGTITGKTITATSLGIGSINIPATDTANQAKFLRGDGTWQTVITTHQSLANYVPTSRTVNSKALSTNISLTAADVGASPTGHTHSYLPLTGGVVTGTTTIKGTAAGNVSYVLNNNTTTDTANSVYARSIRLTAQTNGNCGIYDITNSKWMILANASGDVTVYGNAQTATTATKVGTGTVGSGTKPIYINGGTPTAFTATVGTTTKPVYLNGGVITECNSYPSIPNLSISTSTHGGNAVTGVSVSNHAITITKGSTFTTAHNVTLSTSTHGGNCITALAVSGHAITVTKGITALTSHQTQTQLSISTSTHGGNAVTGVSVSNHAITITKASTFSVSTHTHSNYLGTGATAVAATTATKWNGHPFGWGTGAKTAGATDTANASMIYFQYVN